MKKLGKGWQYTVYDLGNGRVLKRYNTWIDSYLVMLHDAFIHHRLPVINFSYYYREGKRVAMESLKKISVSNIDKSMFGNPTICSNYDYEQDVVEPLAQSFKNGTMSSGRLLIDKFALFNKKLIKNGMIEKNFNIADNFGLNNSGDIIMIDIGEVCTDKNEIQEQLKRRVWSAPDVLKKIPINFQQYFIETMDKSFGIERL